MTKFSRAVMVGVALLGLFGSLSAVQAAPLLPDEFNAENGGAGALGYTGFADYIVQSGSVDLIGNGFFDAYAGNGLYVDLAGSSFGSIASATIYGPGTYSVTTALGGPIAANFVDGVRIGFGSSFVDHILSGLTTGIFVDTFTLLAPSAISFTDLGLSGNPNVGATLFGSSVTAVPEPSTLAVLGAALLLGFTLWRRGRNSRRHPTMA